MPQSFRPDENPISEEEARLILDRLHTDQPTLSADPTLEAICEVTGEPRESVLEMLQKLRKERREAQLVSEMLEMERPLYQVERPLTIEPRQDAFSAYAAKRAAANDLLDDLQEREERNIRRGRRIADSQTTEGVQSKIGLIFVLLLAIFAIAEILLHLPKA